MKESIIWNDDIVDAWDAAMRESGKVNPFSMDVFRRLGDSGITLLEVRTRLGHIIAKREKERHRDERRLLDFYENKKLEFEQGLVDACLESAQGSIFLLKTRYGYREGSDLNITAGDESARKVVRSWGVDASAEGGVSEGASEGSQV